MARYIDVEKIHYYPEYTETPSDYEVERVAYKSDIDNIPSADVQEVYHGKWKQVSSKAPKYVCTNCRHLFNNRTFKYCPNCGARIEKE